MWINRDLQSFLKSTQALPIKILKGPRQVGKTSLLEKLSGFKVIYFDDLMTRRAASENPRMFFDQFTEPLILDEASLVPEIFLELKRRVDEQRRDPSLPKVDFWITGSNQTLLQKNVRESLAGRASYFSLNTLSMHEIGDAKLGDFLIRGGWPELYVNREISPVRYLNDFAHTFIEKDIVAAAGIERSGAFGKALSLIAGRVGQLVNSSDIAKNVGVDTTTIQSWTRLLQQNGVVSIVPPYTTNLNQRLIKTPKIFFDDVGLASRLQGWSDILPLMSSSQFGHLVENLAFTEISKFFTNCGEDPKIYFVRSKDQVEVDFLIEFNNNRFIAIEVKATPESWSEKQHELIESLGINVVEKWVVTPSNLSTSFINNPAVKLIEYKNIWAELQRFSSAG